MTPDTAKAPYELSSLHNKMQLFTLACQQDHALVNKGIQILGQAYSSRSALERGIGFARLTSLAITTMFKYTFLWKKDHPVSQLIQISLTPKPKNRQRSVIMAFMKNFMSEPNPNNKGFATGPWAMLRLAGENATLLTDIARHASLRETSRSTVLTEIMQSDHKLKLPKLAQELWKSDPFIKEGIERMVAGMIIGNLRESPAFTGPYKELREQIRSLMDGNLNTQAFSIYSQKLQQHLQSANPENSMLHMMHQQFVARMEKGIAALETVRPDSPLVAGIKNLFESSGIARDYQTFPKLLMIISATISKLTVEDLAPLRALAEDKILGEKQEKTPESVAERKAFLRDLQQKIAISISDTDRRTSRDSQDPTSQSTTSQLHQYLTQAHQGFVDLISAQTVQFILPQIPPVLLSSVMKDTNPDFVFMQQMSRLFLEQLSLRSLQDIHGSLASGEGIFRAITKAFADTSQTDFSQAAHKLLQENPESSFKFLCAITCRFFELKDSSDVIKVVRALREITSDKDINLLETIKLISRAHALSKVKKGDDSQIPPLSAKEIEYLQKIYLKIQSTGLIPVLQSSERYTKLQGSFLKKSSIAIAKANEERTGLKWLFKVTEESAKQFAIRNPAESSAILLEGAKITAQFQEGRYLEATQSVLATTVSNTMSIASYGITALWSSVSSSLQAIYAASDEGMDIARYSVSESRFSDMTSRDTFSALPQDDRDSFSSSLSNRDTFSSPRRSLGSGATTAFISQTQENARALVGRLSQSI